MEQTIQQADSGWWIISHQQKIWLPQGALPQGRAGAWGLAGLSGARIGEYQQQPVWLVRKSCARDMVSVRQLIDDQPLFQLAGRGVQLAEFYRTHQFCGCCGQATQLMRHEWAMLCGHCQQRYYPQIAPCIIVAIRREERILLAQHTRHRNGLHTVLAGFVEVGETLEQAVAREVMEESHLRVKNVRYITSQPWPFPHSLMTAWMADYDSGELCIDPDELLQADWYHYDQLPPLPPVGTVARRLIEDTLVLCRACG